MSSTITQLVIVAAVVFVVWNLVAGFRDHKARNSKWGATPEVTADVMVQGWTKHQLGAILEEFMLKYELTTPLAEEPLDGGWTRLAFKQPVTVDIVYFLVNYLHYPDEQDLKRAKPTAVGRFRTVRELGAVPGKWAKVYVPVGDTEYDLVHVRTEDGATYQVSFATLKWEPAAKVGMSAAVRSVPFGPEQG